MHSFLFGFNALVFILFLYFIYIWLYRFVGSLSVESPRLFAVQHLHFFFFFLFSSASFSVERSILMAPLAPVKLVGMKSSSLLLLRAFLPVSMKRVSTPSPVRAHVS